MGIVEEGSITNTYNPCYPLPLSVILKPVKKLVFTLITPLVFTFGVIVTGIGINLNASVATDCIMFPTSPGCSSLPKPQPKKPSKLVERSKVMILATTKTPTIPKPEPPPCLIHCDLNGRCTLEDCTQ